LLRPVSQAQGGTRTNGGSLDERFAGGFDASTNGAVLKNTGKPVPQKLDQAVSMLDGANKVTALLLTMGKPLADRIIKQFDNREIRLVARCASKLPAISEEVIEDLVDELNAKIGTSQELVGSTDGAQKLISGVVSDDQIAEIMSELAGTASERVWSKLGDAADEKLTEFIANERPQVAAVVLSKLNVEKASSVMEKLSSEQRADLSQRLLSLQPIGDTAMRLISERLSKELFGQVVVAKELSKHARLGAILTNLERTLISEVLRDIEATAPEDARLVKAHIFSFEDIDGMTDEDRSRLFDEVPSERAVLALKGTGQELRELVLRSISPRSRRIIEAELAADIKVPNKSIVDAKRAIAALAMSMADKSLIRLRAVGEQEVPS
jgi:flagellar motor switch protein FliG